MDNYEVSDTSMPMGERPDGATSEPEGYVIPEERKNLVKDILKRIEEGRDFHSHAFKRMREDIKFARNPLPAGCSEDDHYSANLVQRHVQQRTAALYAKNPKARARRRERLFYQLWDGKPESLMQAQATVQTFAQMAMTGGIGFDGLPVGMPPEMMLQVQQAQALLDEVQQVEQQKQMLERTGKTLEILFHHSLTEQVPPFKTNAKQLVRRTVETGVGYVKLGFQRAMNRSPEQMSQINDLTRRMERLEELACAVDRKEGDTSAAELEQLRVTLAALQSAPDTLVKEGLVYGFPRSTAIIIDPYCTYLKGFVGANWLTEEFYFSPAEIKALYGKDLKKGDYTAYDSSGAKNEKDGKCRVYEFYDRRDGLMYTVAEGYCDFLEEPREPSVKLERFFPYYALTFNDLESSDDDTKSSIFPPSDVRLIRSHQIEYNRSREALREHRVANRPQYAAPKGRIEDTEKEKLSSGAAHAVVELNSIGQGEDVNKLLQQIKKHGIDPNLYDTSFVFDDMTRVVGTSEPQFGGDAKDATATAVSVGEGARVVNQSSAIDDLDDMLTELARDAGIVMLSEISPETAKRVAGPGAVWPQLSRQDVADEIWLEIEAGSSGKPNKAAEIANFERMIPLGVQIPGISPMWLAREFVKRLDDRADLDQAIIEGLPSITAMNGMSKSMSTAPEEQGAAGAENEKKPDEGRGPPSGVMPAPGDRAGGAMA